MLLKKNILILLTALFLLLLLFSCQPGGLVQKRSEPASVDSVLFFTQKEISDPFLESLTTERDEEIVLTMQLLPPPAPPPPDYRQLDGFRVQVFAGLDSLNALAIKNELKSKVDEPVYLLNEKGLYKVQIGDFQYRVDADNRNMVLRREGYPGAWVVSRKVRAARTEDAAVKETPVDSDSIPAANPPSTAEPEALTAYRIQILATFDKTRAGRVASDLETRFSRPSWFEEQNGLFKVYLGKFADRESAEMVLREVRMNGYPDAWLVY